jgi:hypothetical protein
MSPWLFVSVIMPVLVAAVAYVGVLLHERDLRKRRGIKPGE